MTTGQIEHFFAKDTASGTMGEKGTGLGLLLSTELIERNVGKLAATPAQRKGSRFYFSLPMVK